MPAPNIDPRRAKKYLTTPQLRERWGDCSHMFIERLIKSDPKFPRVYRFGPHARIRLFDLDDVEAYERSQIHAGSDDAA